MSGRRRLDRLLSTLLRGRSARLVAAAALIAVAMTFVLQTGSQALDEAKGGVLYVGAPSVSYPSARSAGTASREYMDTASKETLLALGVTEGEMSSHAVRRALASISHPPEEGEESITEEAALRAGENYLAQAGRSAWGGSDTPPEDNSDEQLASSGTERIRPELGDDRAATEEGGRDEIDDGGERSGGGEGGDANSSTDDDSLMEGELGSDPPQLEGGEGSQASPEYASMEPVVSEPDISQAEGVESSPAVFDDEVDEEPESSDEPIGSEAEATEAPDEAPEMEFASLTVSQGEPEEVVPAFPDGEDVVSEEAAPVPDPAPEESEEGPTMEGTAPEPAPVERPPLQDSPEEPTPEPVPVERPPSQRPPGESPTVHAPESGPVERPPSHNSPEESPPLPAVLAVAAPPSPAPPETQDDSWAVVSTVITSVEVPAGRPVPGKDPPPSPTSGSPHRPPATAPHEPAAPTPAPHKPQPDEERPTPTPAEPPGGDHPGSPVDEKLSEGVPGPDDKPGGGVSAQNPPPDVEPETTPDNGRPTTDPEGDDPPTKPEGDVGPGNDPADDANNPPSPQTSGDSMPSPAPDGGDSPGRVPASTGERRVASHSEVISSGSRRTSMNGSDGSSPSGAAGVPDVYRAMIRLRPSDLEGSAGYAVERILPDRTVEPIYEGDVGSEAAVAIGVVAGGVPPEELRPTPAALTDAAAELATYQSSGQSPPAPESDGAATMDTAAPATAAPAIAANPPGPVGSEGAQRSSPSFIGGEDGGPIGIPEPSETPQTALEPPVPQDQTIAPQSTPHHYGQTASDSSSTIPMPYEKTVAEQTILAQTAPAETAPAETVSEQSLPGQTAPAQVAPAQVAPAQTVSGQAGYGGSVSPGTGVAGQVAIEPSIVEPPAPYQPIPEQQAPAPKVQPHAVQPQQIQQPAQGTPTAQEIPAVSATPAASSVAVTPVSPHPTVAYMAPSAPTPEPQQTVSAGQPPGVEQQISAQPAASTNTQTNIQTNQAPIDSSIRNIASPGG